MSTSSSTPPKSALREYLVLAVIILIGTPLAFWWGDRDGRELAAQAYGENAGSEAAADEAADGEGATDDGAEAPGSSPEAIARGAAIFQAQCVACHGTNADGKGPAAVAFTPAPRDFTDPAAKWTIGREPAQIHQAVSQGVPGTGMAGFAAALSAGDLWDLVHYISSLPGVADAQ